MSELVEMQAVRQTFIRQNTKAMRCLLDGADILEAVAYHLRAGDVFGPDGLASLDAAAATFRAMAADLNGQLEEGSAPSPRTL